MRVGSSARGLNDGAVDGDFVRFYLDVLDLSLLTSYLEFFITGN